MIREYPVIPQEDLDRQGESWIACDHVEHTPAVWEGQRFVDAAMIGEPRPGAAWGPGDVGKVVFDEILDGDEVTQERVVVTVDMVGEQRLWIAEDIGVCCARGTLVKAAKDGKACDARAQVFPEVMTRQEGRRTITETFAPLPEGWASSSPNALDGAADFCPEHAYRIAVVPVGEPVPDPLTEG